MVCVLLVGAFGQRNPGDEALLTAFQHALAGCDLVVASSNPALTTAAHGLPAIASGNPVAVARALRRSEAVVFAGGTVFKTLHPSTGRPPRDLLRKAVALAFAAHLARRRVVLLGVGAGRLPDPAARRLARALVARSDLLVLRDEESARALAAAGAPAPLRVGADQAWTLVADSPPPAPGPAERGRAVVALSHLAAETPSGVVAPVVVACRHLLSRGVDVDLQPWQVGGPGLDDLDLAQQVHAELLREGGADTAARVGVIAPPTSLPSCRDLYATSRLVVGLRFHALVAAAAAGTPFLALAHEDKLSALARRMGQPAVGEERGVALDAALRTALDAALAGDRPSPAAVRAEVAAAEEGFALLRLLLGAGDVPDADEITGLRLEPTPWNS